jgi:hypothetical protein
MLGQAILSLGATVVFCGSMHGAALAQETLRLDRPIFTTSATTLCQRQTDISALHRASEASDRAAVERTLGTRCKAVGPDIRLTVAAMPGLYDPDVEVRVASAPDLDPSLPRGKMWTLKSMLRN